MTVKNEILNKLQGTDQIALKLTLVLRMLSQRRKIEILAKNCKKESNCSVMPRGLQGFEFLKKLEKISKYFMLVYL